MGARLELWPGPDGARRLVDQAVVEQWLALYNACPWATPFQHPAFVNTWYACYHQEARPVVVAEFDEADALVGLLLLAEFEGKLVGAGAQQAEYQVWLASPLTSSGFAARAVLAARAAAPGLPLQLKYVPADAPLADVAAAPALRQYAEVIAHRRPLMRVDHADITASLRKKSNASRLNRLKRAGAVTLERITDTRARAEILDEISTLYDFRQGAVNGDCPFRDDRQKRGFHLAWMAAAAEQLHVTVLRAGDRIVSALLGVIGRDTVHVAILTHSPFYARHSPGKFHLMLAGLDLAPTGIRFLDLTPGGTWKERFADTADEVHELRVHQGRTQRVRAAWVDRSRSAAKRVIRAVGLEPTAVAAALVAARRVRVGSAARVLARWVGQDIELRLYTSRPSAAPAPDRGVSIRKDCIEDLLKFEPAERWQSRQGFLATALERLERGQHVFTISNGDRLLHYGWLAEEAQDMSFTEVGQSFTLPEPSAVLYDFYTDPRERGRGHYQQSVRHILRELAAAGVPKAFMCAVADNAPSRRVIEEVGCEYLGSLWHRRRFGRDTRWRTVKELATTAQDPASACQRHA